MSKYVKLAEAGDFSLWGNGSQRILNYLGDQIMFPAGDTTDLGWLLEEAEEFENE